jgi:phytoene synthase
MANCPRPLVRSPRIMSEVYHGILVKLLATGWKAPRTRVRMARARLLWILLRHAVG